LTRNLKRINAREIAFGVKLEKLNLDMD